MTPGDLVTCTSCGAEGRVWSTGAQHVDGWPVLVAWPCGRHAVESTGAAERPPLCLGCDDKRLGLPTPNLPPCAIPQSPPMDAGEAPFRVGPGDRCGSSPSVQKAPLERPSDPTVDRAAAQVAKFTAQLGLGI